MVTSVGHSDRLGEDRWVADKDEHVAVVHLYRIAAAEDVSESSTASERPDSLFLSHVASELGLRRRRSHGAA